MMSPAKIATSFAVLFAFLFSKASADLAKPCNPEKCKLPLCFCSGTKIPGNLSVSSIPQIVMITFDAAIKGDGFSLYKALFSGQFKNPNDCNISATFFVSHEYTDYCMVRELYNQRHEIADNSISRRLPSSWWKSATEKEFTEEIAGMREILKKWGYVNPEDVKGYRAPYLQIGGNAEFKALKDAKFMYESSMPTRKYRDPPLWPYTLEYRSTQDCVMEPCPTDSFPGLWEVPLVEYKTKNGRFCSFTDSCAPFDTAEEVSKLFNSNFERHYTTNRAPFSMLLEDQWLANSTYFNETVNFLKKLASMRDVWVVTISQALEWIKNPTTLENIKDFAPWKCDCRTCYYPERERAMRTCAPRCPPHYPWVGNPHGN